MTKRRIALGAAMLLTLGTAVASTFLYGHEQAAMVEQQQITLPSDTLTSEQGSSVSTVTPEQIAMWKATAASTDYEGLKAPI
ncbi:hypothetical protein [Steroidobacter agaridevorans]|uniref:hypothetical protein n=1 Tax=Steroidobacter agaridevorans TaxID=2695856 RepID=UPI0013288E48|nr:hypothetical protein [Steroidobacter agaridevorans]GFE90343.1 hypothetical protein GCM10011488_52970 [Steroidobacter agaridevorans]